MRYPVDYETLQQTMTGELGWTPAEFWRSTVYDCNLALQGRAEQVTAEIERHAEMTAALINGIAQAYRAKSFKPKKGTDLFRRKRSEEQQAEAKDQAGSYRERLRKAPQTLPHSHFNGRPIPSQRTG